MSPLEMNRRKKPENSPLAAGLPYGWQKGIFSGTLVAVLLAVVCCPALALPGSAPGGGSGQFNQGIPVYWPYHVLFISTGLILLVAGFFIARFHKTGNWYKTHVILEVTGGACMIAGLIIGIYMVALSGFPHLRNIHEILGAIIGTLVIITLIIGYSIKRVNTSKNVVRKSHRWLGRILIILIGINILLGLVFLAAILGR
jgi:hypothetical protein